MGEIGVIYPKVIKIEEGVVARVDGLRLNIENTSDGKTVMAEYEKGSLYNLPVPLHPGENDIKIRIRGSESDAGFERVIKVYGEGKAHLSNGFEIDVEYKNGAKQFYDKKEGLLKKMTSVFADACLFLENGKKDILRVEVLWVPQSRKAAAGMWENPPPLTFHSGLFKAPEKEIVAAAWHEAAHVIKKQFEEKNPRRWLKFRKIYDEIKQGSEKAGENVKKNAVFEAFDESNYLKIDEKVGHPYDADWELFASGSTVLRCFPKEFMEKVKCLGEDNRMLAIETAKFIADAYLNHPNCPKDFFDKKLLEFLGIKTKEEEKKKAKIGS